jgi:Spy/CpxP family protein refolding chaperone
MWKKTRLYLIVASVALNMAFVATWIARGAVTRFDRLDTAHTIWCPLHRELGVTIDQWSRIEPRLQGFQAAVRELCQETTRTRAEVISLISAEQPDRRIIRAKQDEILATKRRIQQLVVEHLLAEKEDLTAEQQEKLFAMLLFHTKCADGPPLSGRSDNGLAPVLTNSHENVE